MTATLPIADFDPTSTGFSTRPDYFEVLRALRDGAPVYRFAPGLVTVARYDDIREVSRDPHRFISSRGVTVNDPVRSSDGGGESITSILFLDPPEHTKHRKLMNRRFTPRAVSELEERVRDLARKVFDDAPVGTPIDLVDHLTAPFPLLMIAELLGIPDRDRGDFRRWSDALIDGGDQPPDEVMATVIEMHGYLMAHVEAKRQDPVDDLISMLAYAEIDGRPLSPDEIFGWLLSLLVAGNETTRTLLSGSVVALAEHPDQRALLAGDFALIPTAVEECLRWVTPIQTFCRTVVADTEIGGHDVSEGDYLIMLYASGNRDERAFGPTADHFDVTRPVNPAHVAFGFAEHLCLGAALARLEARIFLEELLDRFPGYELAGVPERVASTLVAGIHTLPIVLTP